MRETGQIGKHGFGRTMPLVGPARWEPEVSAEVGPRGGWTAGGGPEGGISNQVSQTDVSATVTAQGSYVQRDPRICRSWQATRGAKHMPFFFFLEGAEVVLAENDFRVEVGGAVAS